jgi:hypothetical protein
MENNEARLMFGVSTLFSLAALFLVVMLIRV